MYICKYVSGLSDYHDPAIQLIISHCMSINLFNVGFETSHRLSVVGIWIYARKYAMLRSRLRNKATQTKNRSRTVIIY